MASVIENSKHDAITDLIPVHYHEKPFDLRVSWCRASYPSMRRDPILRPNLASESLLLAIRNQDDSLELLNPFLVKDSNVPLIKSSISFGLDHFEPLNLSIKS